MVGGVDEHVEDHGAAVGIVAAFPGGDVPGALELLGGYGRQDRENVIEGLFE